jgi:hypothetical protein
MALPKYVRLSNVEAQTLRALGHNLPYVYCPSNGLLINTENVDRDTLGAAVALLHCGDERRQTVASSFVADFFMELEMVLDAPLTVPGLEDVLN